MAKGTSFAEKAKRGIKKEKEFKVVKYVKSIVSEKSGHYRFQESMLKVPSGMSLDAYLKELEAGPVEEVEEVADAREEVVEADAPDEKVVVEEVVKAASETEAPEEVAEASEEAVEAEATTEEVVVEAEVTGKKVEEENKTTKKSKLPGDDNQLIEALKIMKGLVASKSY